MIGIVVVSHSRPLAEAAVDFATQMVHGEGPKIAVAAGTDDGGLGTDAAAIALAIGAVDSPDGVLVVLDLGSALLSSELAVEFLDDEVADRVRISAAPLVEGLLAAVVTAAAGSSLEAVDREARDALAGKAGHIAEGQDAPPLLDVRPTPEVTKPPRRVVWRATVRNPHGIHVRPAAAIVAALRELDAEVLLSNATTGRGPAPSDSLSRITALEIVAGQVLEARFAGPDAERARDVLAELAGRDFGEDLTPRPVRAGSQATPRVERVSAHSLELPAAAEHQTVVGRINRSTARPATAGYKPAAPKEELVRFTEAVAVVDEFLAGLGDSGPGIAGIVDAQRMMLADRELQHGVVGLITAGFSAVDAVEKYLSDRAHEFDQFADSYLRERGQDVRSLRRLLLLALMGRPLADQGPDEARIWLLEELDVATAVRLDPRTCLGVITLAGGSSGHGMLAAQARGIPILTGRPEAEKLPDGALVAFDPVTRELWLDVTPELRAEFDKRNHARVTDAEQARSRAHEPALTADGRRILVEANVGSLDDAVVAAREGAEGSGVVRTEVLFGASPSAPSTEEQTDILVRVGQAIGGPITVRSWDPAGDKPMAFLPRVFEDNPALGERGIRLMRRLPELFADQMRAVLLASRQVEVRLMLPMVTVPDEVVWARSVFEQVRSELGVSPIPLGMMVEVPAAAIRAADFAGLVDFVSIGTNDLSQYTQAADRTNGTVRDLARQDAPAVLDLVQATCAGLQGVPIAVCGDLASDPSAIATLIGFGVTELSVRPRMVAEIKQAVRLV